MNKILREEMEYLIKCDDKAITPDVKDDVKMTLDYIDELELNNKSLNSLLNSVKHSLRNSEEHLKIEQGLNYDLYKQIDKAIEYINIVKHFALFDKVNILSINS